MSCIAPFTYTSSDNCGSERKIWLQRFEYFMHALPNPDDDLDWCALLLHFGGPRVQQVHLALESDAPLEEEQRGPLVTGYITKFDVLKKRLTNFFAPKRNPTYERCVFRKMKQLANEKIDVYVVRLRDQAERCEFGDRAEESMKDQITSCCASKEVRKKILCRHECTLDDVLTIARTIEAVEEEGKIFSEERSTAADGPSREVNSVQQRRKPGSQWRPNRNRPETSCGRCGRSGHYSKDEKCPAKDKKCLKCGSIEHFAKKCF